MKGYDRKYGEVNTERGRTVADDEPLFILRGKDVIMPHALEAYAAMAQDHDPEMAEGIRERAREVIAWQHANHEHVDLPDTAPGQIQ